MLADDARLHIYSSRGFIIRFNQISNVLMNLRSINIFPGGHNSKSKDIDHKIFYIYLFFYFFYNFLICITYVYIYIIIK